MHIVSRTQNFSCTSQMQRRQAKIKRCWWDQYVPLSIRTKHKYKSETKLINVNVVATVLRARCWPNEKNIILYTFFTRTKKHVTLYKPVLPQLDESPSEKYKRKRNFLCDMAVSSRIISVNIFPPILREFWMLLQKKTTAAHGNWQKDVRTIRGTEQLTGFLYTPGFRGEKLVFFGVFGKYFG